MPGKSSDKKTKAKKSEQGTVGVVFGGLLTSKATKLVWTESTDVDDVFSEDVKTYGKYTKGSFVKMEDPEKVFNVVSKKYKDVHDSGDLYSANHGTLLTTIKEESGLNKPKAFKKGESKPGPKKEKKENDGSGEEESEGEAEEKPKKNSKSSKDKNDKKSSKSTKSKKDESEDEESEGEVEDDAEEEESEEDEPKKNSKSKAKVSKSSKDEKPKKNSKSKGK